MTEPPSWPELLILTVAGCLLIAFGVGLTLIYCDYRRGQDIELTHAALAIGTRCVTTLGEVVPGAIIVARQSRPVAIRSEPRDSLRERRWTSP